MKLILLLAASYLSAVSSFTVAPRAKMLTHVAYNSYGFDVDMPADELLTEGFMTEIACKAEGLRGRNPEVDDRSLIPPFHAHKADASKVKETTMVDETPVDELLTEAFLSQIDLDAEMSAMKSGRNDGNMI
jgi:hypothetical protein